MQNNLKDVSLVIHAGDYKDIEVVKTLKENGSFRGVWGNNREKLFSYMILDLVGKQPNVQLKFF